MPSSQTQQHFKITDIVPIEYEDFLTYCSIAGKRFSDEITPVDYVAYHSQFGRDKSEVKQLRSIIEAGVMLDKSETEIEERPIISTGEVELSIERTKMPIEKSSLIATMTVTVDDAEAKNVCGIGYQLSPENQQP